MPVNSSFRPAVLIPCYNHGTTLKALLASLAYLHLPVLIVDDGSDEATKECICAAIEAFPETELLTRKENGGKGAAVMDGASYLAARNFTHFLQIDADGQHDTRDAKKLLELAQAHPEDVISGRPIYDDSVPKKRLYGRYITHFWVWLETLSFEIKDSMCGFRVYPLKSFQALASKRKFGLGMDFDVDVMVRLFWYGVHFHFIPTAVRYPQDGISHFDLVGDNIKIAKMHSRLFFESLLHIPTRLTRTSSGHWSSLKERRGESGFRFLLWVYRKLGREVFYLVLIPVILSFWLTGRTQRQASQEYLKRIEARRRELNLVPIKYSSFSHFMHFGEAILDKLAAWSPERKMRWRFYDEESERLLTHTQGQRGKLVLVSHLGVAEACRAISERSGGPKIHALVFDLHSPRMRKILEETSAESTVNMIPVHEITVETIGYLEEKIAKGDWVAIAADRTPVTESKQSRVKFADFLGESAPFPIGAYVLASLLKCETLTLFAIREGNELVVEGRHFADLIVLPRKTREAELERCVEKYAKELERKALEAPLEWFNFYDFWAR